MSGPRFFAFYSDIQYLPKIFPGVFMYCNLRLNNKGSSYSKKYSVWFPFYKRFNFNNIHDIQDSWVVEIGMRSRVKNYIWCSQEKGKLKTEE